MRKSGEEKEEAPPKRKRGKSYAEAHTFLDINQLELAVINRALRGARRSELPSFADIGRTERILKLQQKNLQDLCRRLGKEWRKGELERELKAILDGRAGLSLVCFAPKSELWGRRK